MRANDSFGVSDHAATQLSRGVPVNDGLSIIGHVHLQLFDEFGNLKHEQETNNLVVTAGKNHIADQLSSAPGGGAMSHMAIGTGSSAAAAGDTALGTETDRNALTSRTDATNVVTYVGTWAPGDGTSAVLREAGIFNAGAAGTMLARVVYSNIDKQAGDTLTITWTVTVG
jgi:hypothetical protein